jgi:Dolichyl-phosphate-mannose-protein mannosyltransferase
LTKAYWALALAAVALLAVALRLHGIHDPLLDHPGWRQGDTATIARNFARLQFNILYPQTSYNGPPPNYVELELQIVPFLAAALYKLFGIHEIFGRLLTAAFSLATVLTLAYFARWLFASALAGVVAAFFYAVFPGSVYYGRTFMPDSAMVFLLTVALYAAARYLASAGRLSPGGLTAATSLLALAYLAKPVAALAVVPLVGMLGERVRAKRATPVAFALVLVVVPLLILTAYDRVVDAHADWHWASGITRLHVLPALRDALTEPAAFVAKLVQFRIVTGILRDTVLGAPSFALAIASVIALPWLAPRSKALLWGWVAGGLLYVYAVVTVERVDYYMLPLLPLCALSIGGAIARFAAVVRGAAIAPAGRYALLALIPLVGLAVLLTSRAPVAAYYAYGKQTYRDAVALDAALPKGALIVIGHYGPEIQYYIDRFGWEEDPALWTPFDEQSAIRKGARYFISIEDNRLRANAELCAWMQRFPLFPGSARWPVYETDPAKVAPDADRFWRAFRAAERMGRGRALLDAHRRCLITRSR